MTTWVGYSDSWKAWLLRIEERGEEVKVPYHASAAAVRDSNLPYIMANSLYSQYWQLFFCGCYLYITNVINMML